MEAGERVTQRNKNAVGKRKKTSTSATGGGKSDIQFIVNAIANTKSAVRYMLDNKISNRVVALSHLSLRELTYEDIYQRKTVAAEDMQYFYDRQTTETILGRIDADISSSPSFEWLPRTVLSAEQLRTMELKQVELTEQSTAAHEVCSRILTRRKESTEREVVTRVTNETQLRMEAKQLNAQAKTMAKQVEVEAKAMAKQVEAEAKAEAKAAKAVEKKQVADAKAAERKATADGKNAEKKQQQRGAIGAKNMAAVGAVQAAAASGGGMAVEAVQAAAASGGGIAVGAVQAAAASDGMAVGAVQAATASGGMAVGAVQSATASGGMTIGAAAGSDLGTVVAVGAVDEVAAVSVGVVAVVGEAFKGITASDGVDNSAQPKVAKNVEETALNQQYSQQLLVLPVIGKRKRDEYTPQQLVLGRKVKDIIQRLLRRREQHSLTTAVKINPTSRRTSNINDFSESLLQEFGEIDSVYYKLSYIALPDIFDVDLDGYSSASTFNTETERKVFLIKLSAALYNKFKCSTSDDDVLKNISFL